VASPAAGESKVPATVFPLNGDPKRVWLSGHHREVLKTLDAAIEQGRGVLLLTGEPGSGKTTLTRVLLEGLIGTGVRVGRLPSPDLEPLEFSTILGERFPERGQRVLLVIDDAHALRPALFAELVRLLEADHHVSDQIGVFNVLLVGQSQLETILQTPEHAALAKFIRVRCRLRPFTSNQVAGYVWYHLGVAGLDSNWFTPEAIEEICTRSGGIPRLINILCDRTLRAALLAGAQTVDAALVRQCVADEPSEPVSEPEASAEVAEEVDDLLEEDFAEADRRWRMIRVGGGAVLGLAIALGLLVYFGWRSSSWDASTSGTSKIIELPPRDPEPVAPSATTTPPPPSPAAVTTNGERPSAMVPEKASPESSGATRPPPLLPRATATASGERPPLVAPEKAGPPPPPARERATVSAKRPPVVAPKEASAPPPVAAPLGATRTSVAPPTTTTDEPDPSAIIDWLLKQTPRRPE